MEGRADRGRPGVSGVTESWLRFFGVEVWRGVGPRLTEADGRGGCGLITGGRGLERPRVCGRTGLGRGASCLRGIGGLGRCALGRCECGVGGCEGVGVFRREEEWEEPVGLLGRCVRVCVSETAELTWLELARDECWWWEWADEGRNGTERGAGRGGGKTEWGIMCGISLRGGGGGPETVVLG